MPLIRQSACQEVSWGKKGRKSSPTSPCASSMMRSCSEVVERRTSHQPQRTRGSQHRLPLSVYFTPFVAPFPLPFARLNQYWITAPMITQTSLMSGWESTR